MLRLTLILCIGMFAALMIAGEDRGQLRPGLAAAAAKKVLPGSGAVAGADSELAATEPEVDTVRVAAPVVDEPAVAEPMPTVAAAQPAEPTPYVEPERELVTAVEEPIFSLAAVGNEAPPSGPETPQPEVLAGGEGTIWYVNARSVNVRAEPSTQAEVVGKLSSGEATLVVQAVNDEWARIVIQGDGLEGFIALRYLSAEAP
jgi:uncharacterized protein YgiM (DUF1202 family)